MSLPGVRRDLLLLIGSALLASAACPGAAAELPALPELSQVRPFVLERDGAFHLLADLSPVWSQLESLPSTDARKLFLGASALMLVRRHAVAKFPTAAAFQVKLVKVVEYDNYHRPILATARPLLEGPIPTSRLPADASLEATLKAARAVLDSLSFTVANLR